MLPIKPVNDKLYVVTMISNPSRYRSRYAHYRNFAKHIEDSGAVLITVEIAHGDREFEITSGDNPNDIQLRSNTEIWNKETALNIAISRLPADWKYVAWIDADVQFTKPLWVEETIHLLQQYDIIQMFSHAMDVGPNHEPLKVHKGFMACWHDNDCLPPEGMAKYGLNQWHSGYAWAATRNAVNAVGGLIEIAIVGSADRYMATALIGEMKHAFFAQLFIDCPRYIEICMQWQDRAERSIRRNVGYMGGLLVHYWHGKKSARGYNTRWKIMTDCKFDPLVHIHKDSQGLWQIANVPETIKFRADLHRYFASRNEDGNEV